jgi:hypothetical protein
MLLVNLWFSGNSEVGGKGDKTPDHSTTIALQSPLSEYNGRFEIGLGQSMVRFSFIYCTCMYRSNPSYCST